MGDCIAWFVILGGEANRYEGLEGGGANLEGSGASYSPILEDVIKSVEALGRLRLGEKV